MFPLLFAAKALAKMSSFGGGSKPARNTESDAESEQTSETVLDKDGKEHAADSPKGKMIINMRGEEEAPEMFGGMDLNKIKSALDEDSPLGMPEEVKGGVYKQIFEVNKMMLGSLQRIEGTLKLMLNLEYERALAFQQADVQQNLIEGDTDPDPDPEAGPGRFRRGLSSAGGMLGGAYSKAKGSSLIKLLGLGALIFAFNKYRDEIIAATASILKYFNDVYDVFKSEGLGAAFDKVVDDFKNIFFPKIKEVSLGILDFLWGAIKGVAMEWLFGASGDKLIKQENLNRSKGVENLQSMTGDLTAAGVNLSASKVGDQSMIGRDQSGKFFLTENEQTKNLNKEQMKNTDMSINKALKAMADITSESEGRIQWKGLPNLLDTINYSLGDLAGVSINDILNAVPIIDGFESTNEQLKEFRLFKSAGVTKETPEADRDLIFKNLAEMSSIRSALLEGKTSGRFNRVEYDSADSMKARIEELKKDNVFLGAYTQTEIDEMTGNTSSFTTPDDTKPKEEVKKMSAAFQSMQTQFINRQNYERAMNSQRPLTLADQKTINNVNAGTVNNLPMSSGKTSWTAMLYANAGTVYQQSN